MRLLWIGFAAFVLAVLFTFALLTVLQPWLP